MDKPRANTATAVPGAKCIPLDGAQRNIPVGAETPSMRRRRSLAAGQASPTRALVSVALSALLVGLFPYLTDRPAGSAWLIPTIAWLQGMNSFGRAGLWLPSFAHPFAFSLLTAMALPVYAGWRYGACLGWFAVNAVFELGQLPRVAAWLADSTNQARGHSQLTQALIRYFMQGSFGIDDLGAAAAGALCAALVLRLSGAITRDNHAH